LGLLFSITVSTINLQNILLSCNQVSLSYSWSSCTSLYFRKCVVLLRGFLRLGLHSLQKIIHLTVCT